MRIKKRIPYGQIALHGIFLVLVAMFLIPFLLVVSVSLSDENVIIRNGYKLIPEVISLKGYETVFSDTTQLFNSYRTTIIFTFVHTALSVLVMAMLAYPLSRKNFKFRGVVSFYLLFTMLFNAGLVPNYMLITQTLKLRDNIWVYIIPGLVSAWNVFVIRTNYQSLPYELIEAAKLDGASELRICFNIIIPLAVPVLASMGFMRFVAKWNDWGTAMYYIRDRELYSLQYLLQKILNDISYLKEMADSGLLVGDEVFPRESTLYATALVSAGPVLVIFPIFQKYFARGLTIGSVKG